MEFGFLDSWLLASIRNTEDSKEGADLRLIIAYADYSNHAIMTWPELSNALSKLIAVGLVTESNGKLYTTNRFKDWWAKKYEAKKRIDVHKQLTEIENYLNKTLSSFELRDKKVSIELSESDYERALRDYLSMWQDKT